MNQKADSHRILILILGALMAFGPLSIDLYLPSFPLIAADFSISPARVELSLASFFIGLALGQLLYGPLSDRTGRRPAVPLGLGVYVIASMACSIAPSLEFLIIARFVQALGACAGDGMFAYITGTSFVFIELFGISAQNFGWIFGSNAAALIAISQFNRRLLLKREVKSVLRWAFPALALAGSILFLAGYNNWVFWGVWTPLWAYVGILGLTYPNTTALALERLAMPAVVGGCGVSALLVYAVVDGWGRSRSPEVQSHTFKKQMEVRYL